MTDSAKTSTEKRPNVIWIFGDQHRAQAVGYRGDPNVKTPQLDRLAHQGVRFDCAVAGAPWCTPFRAALFTGKYPHQVGCTRTPSKIDPSIPTIAKPLREAGYHTALVGKWHLGGNNQEIPIAPELRGGFDYWMGFEAGNCTYNTPINGSDHEAQKLLPGFHTDEVTTVFINHLKKFTEGNDAQKPFFGVLSVRAPHDPYESPPPFDRHKKEAITLRPNVPDVPWLREKALSELPDYYGMIENLDWNIGRVIDTLRELQIDRETWIVFFSDHGDSLGSHGMFQKSNPYEESIRIPMFIAKATPTKKGEPAHFCDATFTHVDFAPTTLGMCGVKQPDWMCGHDYSQHVLKAEDKNPSAASEPDSAYLQQIHAKGFPAGIDIPWRGVVTRDGWKYACTPGERWMMFNLNEDPYEQANLVFNTKFKAERIKLHARLQRWISETEDDFPLPAVE